jgi:hypothetical protein
MQLIQRTRRAGSSVLPAVLMILFSGVYAWAQETDRGNGDETLNGTVVSTSRNTLVVRSDDGHHQLFVFDEYTRKPSAIRTGSQVRVVSSPGDEPNVRLAKDVAIVPPPGTASAPGSAAGTTAPSGEADRAAQVSPVVPREVRGLERDIERQARRFQVGVRGGMALDPELVLIGIQSQIGPFFHEDLHFRPSVDFGFGEVTAMFSINLDATYRLPITSRAGRWSTYMGVGPSFNFVHQDFERQEGEDRIDFGDFQSDVGLNIFGGLRFRRGTFMEIRTTVYADTVPTLRLMLGYVF